MITQRYATDPDGKPALEVTHWRQIPGHPRAQEDDWVWVTSSELLADVNSLLTPAEVDEVTGVVLDPGGQPTIPPEQFGDLYSLPLRPGYTLIDRDEYAALIATKKDEDD